MELTLSVISLHGETENYSWFTIRPKESLYFTKKLENYAEYLVSAERKLNFFYTVLKEFKITRIILMKILSWSFLKMRSPLAETHLKVVSTVRNSISLN